MPKLVPTPCLDPSATVGAVSTTALRDDPLTVRSRTIWSSGDFHRIATGFAAGAAEFVERVGIRPGERVLDLACGTGNLALPAARAGARVTGVDIAPNLVEHARALAAEAGLDVRFDEGDAEALPYEDAAFDTVLSMFGVMFVPRPELAVAELLRVARPGARFALANWTPAGFIGRMLRAHAALVPPPAGVASPLRWGDPEAVRALFGDRVRRLETTARTLEFVYPYTPAGTVELFRAFYGPTVRTFAALDPAGRATLSHELEQLWSEHDEAGDGTTRVRAEYLEVVGEVA